MSFCFICFTFCFILLLVLIIITFYRNLLTVNIKDMWLDRKARASNIAQVYCFAHSAFRNNYSKRQVSIVFIYFFSIFYCCSQRGRYCQLWQSDISGYFLVRVTWIWAVHNLHNGGRQTAGTTASAKWNTSLWSYNRNTIPIYCCHKVASVLPKLLIVFHRINDLWNLSGEHKGILK